MQLDQLKKAVDEAGLSNLAGGDAGPVQTTDIFCLTSCVACQTNCTIGCSTSCLASSSNAQ